MRVLIFGDSITQGYWDTKGGWAERLRMHYWQKFLSGEDNDPPTVFNLGVSSNSSEDVAERLLVEAQARDNGEGLTIVVAIGVNDSRFKGDDLFSDAATYRQNLEQILAEAQKLTSRILMVGCTSCDEARTNPVSWGSTCYTNERIWKFETVLRQVCEEYRVAHVDIFESFQGGTGLLSDGLHPNDAGHELIYGLVLPELEALTK